MGSTMVRKLVFALLAGLCLALVVSLITRVYVELPALYEVEKFSDQKDIDRVKLALGQSLKILETAAANTGAWDDAYEFVTLAPQDPEYQRYIGATHGWEAHTITQTHGWRYLDTAGRTVFNSYYDLETGQPVTDRDLQMSSLPGVLVTTSERQRGSNTLSSGLSPSNLGLLLIVVADITPSDIDSAPPRGKLVIWRHFDQALRDQLQETTQTAVQFMSISDAQRDVNQASVLSQLHSPEDFVPRGASGQLHWLLYDVAGNPQFLVSQNTLPRVFDDSLFSISLLGQFSTAALVLVLLGTYFLKSVIFRIQNAQLIMAGITNSDDLSARVTEEDGAKDELGRLFSYLNAMLSRMEAQRESLRETNKTLEELSEKDALTGIHNRRFLETNLNFAIRTAARMDRQLAVAMIDIDHFKPYNDNYGHGQGDETLKQVARCLSDNMPRATDIVARYGGEEFSIVMIDTPIEGALEAMHRLCAQVEGLQILHEYAEPSKVVTISIGVISATPRAEDDAAVFLNAADEALYQAKANGRNRVEPSGGLVKK